MEFELSLYIKSIYDYLPFLARHTYPWQIITDLQNLIKNRLHELKSESYVLTDKVAIHESAVIESGAILKPYTIIGPRSNIKSGAYLRGGVYLISDVNVGANSEIKQSILCKNSSAAHLNYIGNSLVGEDVNFEAGSVLANHFNERDRKEIMALVGDRIIATGVTKFGSLVGDGSRIGANAVLNPGTILLPKSIVPRLGLINQI